MSLTSPQECGRVKRRKLNRDGQYPYTKLTHIHKRLVARQESLKHQHKRYEAAWLGAKKEIERRLGVIDGFRTSSLQQLYKVKQGCDLQLQLLTKQLQHNVEMVQSLQKLKRKNEAYNLEPLAKYTLTTPVLDVLPTVHFNEGKVKIKLSKMCVTDLSEVISETPHRCFSSGIVNLVISYTNTPVGFEGKRCLALKGRTKDDDAECVVGLSGGRLATGHNNGSIRIWDSHTGKQLFRFKNHSVITALAAVDDNRLLSSSDDRTLCLWDLCTGRLIRVFRGHTQTIRSVCVFANSKGRLRGASGGGTRRTIRLWNLETGELIQVLRGHTDVVHCISATTDGSQRLVSGSGDMTVRIWNTKTGECLKNLKGHTGDIYSVVMLSDQKRVVSASADKTLRVWNIETGECLKILKGHTSCITSISAFSDGQHVISGGFDANMRVWNVDTGECMTVVVLCSKVWHMCCLDDNRVVSIIMDGKMQVWE